MLFKTFIAGTSQISDSHSSNLRPMVVYKIHIFKLKSNIICIAVVLTNECPANERLFIFR